MSNPVSIDGIDYLVVGDIERGDRFIQPDGDHETREVTGTEWTRGAVEIASVAVTDPARRAVPEVFAADDLLQAARQPLREEPGRKTAANA